MSSILGTICCVFILITLTSAQNEVKVYKAKWDTGFVPMLSSIKYSNILTLLAIIIPAVTIGAILIQMGYFLVVYFKIISSLVFYKFAQFYGIPFVFNVVLDAAHSYIRSVTGLDHEMNGLATDVIKM